MDLVDITCQVTPGVVALVARRHFTPTQMFGLGELSLHIRGTYKPDEIYDEEDLEDWATAHGFTKASTENGATLMARALGLSA